MVIVYTYNRTGQRNNTVRKHYSALSLEFVVKNIRCIAIKFSNLTSLRSVDYRVVISWKPLHGQKRYETTNIGFKLLIIVVCVVHT